ELADLPEFRLDDASGADETAQARTIRAENDRHVAGEINRSDGIRVIVDVRRVQPGFASVGASPARLRPDETHAGPRGVEMDLPLGGEEHLDVLGREEIGSAVRPVEHPD